MKIFKKSYVLLAIMPLIISASACKKEEEEVTPPLPENELLTTKDTKSPKNTCFRNPFIVSFLGSL
jgi:hypothetical protein